MRKFTMIFIVVLAALVATGCNDPQHDASGKRVKKADCEPVFQLNPKYYETDGTEDDGYNRRICTFKYKGMDCIFDTENHGGGMWCDNRKEIADELIERAKPS